jgi:hypothetical protein
LHGRAQVGHVSIFTAAGFAEVSRPTLRRAVMRIDFWQSSGDIPQLNVIVGVCCPVVG